MALCCWASDLFTVEEKVKHGLDVMAFQRLTGKRRYYVAGAYVPPPDVGIVDHIRAAWKQCLKECTPWLLGIST